MSEKPIDAVAVLVGFLAWCNEAPNQQHPVVENTRRLCDALAQTLREKASLESRVAELEKKNAALREAGEVLLGRQPVYANGRPVFPEEVAAWRKAAGEVGR